MQWSFTDERPIYAQLVEQLKLRIVTGLYPPGSRVMAVRELASEAAVNPNTMQRALAALEEQGLVYSQRTAGRFVTEDEAAIRGARRSLAEQHIRNFLRAMEGLGYRKEEIMSLLGQETEEIQ